MENEIDGIKGQLQIFLGGLNMRNLILLAMMTTLAAYAQLGGAEGLPPPIATGSSRGGSGKESGISPWLAASGAYSRDLVEHTVPNQVEGFSPNIAGGISGWKNWSQQRLGVSYMGTANRLVRLGESPDWQQNHVVMLSYAQNLNQRANFGVSQLGGMTHGGYGYGSAFGATGIPGLSGSLGPGSIVGRELGGEFGDLGNNGVVNGELLSSLTKFSSTSGNFSYMLDQRWMVSGSGGLSMVRRSDGQYSQDSTQAGGSLSYRVTRDVQVGGSVSQQNTRYPGLFGGVSSQSAMFNFRTSFSPTLTVSGGGGIGRMSSSFIGEIPIDPALAELLGTATILKVSKTTFLTPYYNAGVSKSFERGALSFTGGRGANSGNGVLMAGVQDMVSVSYAQTVNTRIGASCFLSYQRLSDRVATLKISQTVQTGAILSIRMFRSISFTSQAGVSHQTVAASPSRKFLTASVGVAWTIGNQPFMF